MQKNLMVILERYLTPEGVRLRIGGIVTRDVAHYYGVPHGAVQVAVVAPKVVQGRMVPQVLLHWRSRWKKTYPETWDICGGHIDAVERILTDETAWEDQRFIQGLFAATALREANEEVRLRRHPDFQFREEHIRCFGGLGVFECGFDDPGAQNREYSALYFAFVPGDVLTVGESDDVEEIFLVEDTVGFEGQKKEEVASRLKLVSLPDLVLDFTKNPDSYADGIARILSRARDEPGTRRMLFEFVRSHYQGAGSGRV